MPEFPVYAPAPDEARVLKRARLLRSADLPASHSDHYQMRLGVRSSTRVAWLYEFDGHHRRINAGEPFEMSGVQDASVAISSSDVVVVEWIRSGTPPSLLGTTLLLTLGADPAGVLRRAPGESETLLAALAESGVLDKDVAYPLQDLPPETEADDAHTASLQTVSSATYVDGSVSVTVRKPDGRSVGKVQVKTSVTFGSVAAACTLYASVGETPSLAGAATTDHNEQASNTPDTALRCISTMFAGTIRGTTVFRPRLKKDGGGANADVVRQTISYKVTWF